MRKSTPTKAIIATALFLSVGALIGSTHLSEDDPPHLATTSIASNFGTEQPVALKQPALSVTQRPQVPKSGVKKEGGLTLTVAMEHSVRLLNDDRATVMVEIATDSTEAERSPVAMVIVVDTSGSMSGNKIANARRALGRLMTMVHPGDQIGVVTFSSESQTLLGLVSGVQAAKAVDTITGHEALTASGGTCISCGLSEAYNILRSAPVGLERHVMLLSDGSATVGKTDSTLNQMGSEGLEGGVTTTSIGLGRDVQESVLSDISEGGSGRYYFVRNSASIPELLQTELAQIKTPMVEDIEIRVEFANAKIDFTSAKRPPNSVLSLKRLSSGARHRFIYPLRLGTLDSSDTIARVRATYSDADGQLHELNAASPIAVSDDLRDVEASRNWTVTAEVARQDTTHVLGEALQACGQSNPNLARRLLQSTLSDLRLVQHNAPEERVSMEINEVERVLNEVDSYTHGSLALRGAYLNQHFRTQHAGSGGELTLTPVFLADLDRELE